MKVVLTVFFWVLVEAVWASTTLNNCFSGRIWGISLSGKDCWYLEVKCRYVWEDGPGMPVAYYPEGEFWPATLIEYELSGTGRLTLKGAGSVVSSINMGTVSETMFIEMEEGEIVSTDCFIGNPQVFQRIPSTYSYPWNVTSDYDIIVWTGGVGKKTIYLGFQTRGLYGGGTPAIGWIAIRADTTVADGMLEIVASAMNVDGNPLTVGAIDPNAPPIVVDVPPEELLAGGVRQTDIYVDGSVGVSGDGCSWASPFKSIQEGVDAVRLDGTVVHVKPGVYAPVQVDNRKFTLNGQTCSFTVESTDGPHATIIRGEGIVANLNMSSSPTTACFWYGTDPVDLYDTVRGFTLCSATYGGEKGCFVDCIVSNCWFGVYDATAVNCILVDNFRAGAGGGKMYNCVSTRNGYGMTSTIAYNSVVEGNSVTNRTSGSCKNCCVTPMPQTGNNITNAPLFVDAEAGDFRLRWDSPCIDAGNNDYVQTATDLAGNRRRQGDHVDIGCYEYGAGTEGSTTTTPVAIPYAWLDSHVPSAMSGLGMDYEAMANGTSGKRNRFGVPLTLWQEFVQGTDPTDSNDCFRVEISQVGKVNLSFTPCLPNRRYLLYGAWTLSGPWSSTTNMNDAAFILTNRFFKVGVRMQ